MRFNDDQKIVMTTLGCQRLFICGFLFRLTVIVTARVLGSLPKIALVRLPSRQGEPTKTDFYKV